MLLAAVYLISLHVREFHIFPSISLDCLECLGMARDCEELIWIAENCCAFEGIADKDSKTC